MSTTLGEQESRIEAEVVTIFPPTMLVLVPLAAIATAGVVVVVVLVVLAVLLPPFGLSNVVRLGDIHNHRYDEFKD